MKSFKLVQTKCFFLSFRRSKFFNNFSHSKTRVKRPTSCCVPRWWHGVRCTCTRGPCSESTGRSLPSLRQPPYDLRQHKMDNLQWCLDIRTVRIPRPTSCSDTEAIVRIPRRSRYPNKIVPFGYQDPFGYPPLLGYRDPIIVL